MVFMREQFVPEGIHIEPNTIIGNSLSVVLRVSVCCVCVCVLSVGVGVCVCGCVCVCVCAHVGSYPATSR